MHLKSLTVLGFKSFADKTSLTFQPGITAIVGPNGCGKSNVADAIRWVLGEQSAKALRGGEMADVIFSGTDKRKPIGMAEVSLTISDIDEDHLKAAGVELSFNEVTITRRVFRDGGSEYFINRTSCRLKDIQQLFMGTGVGRASYSIMAQGNITQILSSRPEERRLVFEEAAGITRFKAQKRESLRKLDYTEQNLLRVSDLIREVKRQIGSLQRQAGKARRYKQLSQELQHLDTQLARHQFDVLTTEVSADRREVEGLRGQAEENSALIIQDENEISQLRERLTDLEHQISQIQQQGLELRNQINQHQSRIEFNEEKIRELDAQHETALREIEQAEQRGQETELQLAEVNLRLDEASRNLDRHREDLTGKQQSLQELEAEVSARREAIRSVQADAFSLAQELSKSRNEIHALNLRREGNVVRMEKLSAEKIQLEEERTRLEERLQEFNANVEAEKLDAQTRRGSVEDREARLREIQGDLEVISDRLESQVQEQAGHRSRLHVLQQLQQDREGFGAGAVAALSQTEQALGSLADRLQVPAEYVTAVEAALGHHLELVLTELPESAQQILSDLQAGQKGRASIAPLAFQVHTSQPSPSEHRYGPSASGVIQADPSVRPLLDRLLGDTVIVDDLASATAAWRNGGGALNFVTRRGEILNRHGIYTGGSTNGEGASQGPSSILGRKNEIAELEHKLSDLQSRIEETSRAKGALLSERTELQASLQEAQKQLRAQEVAIAAHEGEVNALRQSLATSHRKIDTVVYEIESLAAQEQEGDQKRTALASGLAELESRERGVEERLASLNTLVEGLMRERDARNQALTEARVAVASEEQVLQSLQRQRDPLALRIGELKELAERRRREVGGYGDRKSQADRAIEESRQRIGTLEHDRDQVSTQLTERASQRESLDADIQQRENALRQRRSHLNELQEQRGRLGIALTQKEMQIRNLKERIQQKYQVDLETVRSECITITLADQGAPKINTLTPKEMSDAGVATDWEAVEVQVSALQERVEGMGPVNLVAIEEYEETEQRYQFLTQQHDDLVKAKTQLLEVISRINTQTREMFTETFNRIRENFQSIFTEVFGGGKADLQLVDEGDVLESGIDIMARPPGKKLQSISLLSGGEQTMTAVSLLFAIYQVKPSPFCVLDELDAPLDEFNINRFIAILQRFLERSQFIIITHNKRTIGMADVLYGVTMEERGISKVVSVKFRKTEDQTAGERGKPLIPQASIAAVDGVEEAPHTREETLELA